MGKSNFYARRKGSLRRTVLLCGALSFLLTACTGRNPSQEEPLVLPDSLKLTAELPGEYPDQAKTYTVDWLEVEEETAVQALFKGETREWTQWAVGRQLLSEDEEVCESLLIYDGVVEGGLSYSYDTKDCSLGGVASYYPGYPDTMEQLNGYYGYHDMQDYATEGDLSFKGQSEASEEIEELLYACGFPQLQLQQAYLLDAKTMNEHLALYNEYRTQIQESREEYEFTQEDECYLFHHRQVLDGIPFANLIWTKGTRDMSTETVMYSLYGKNGILQIEARQFYEIQEPLSADAVISPEEAVAAYVEEYTKALQFEETEIFAVELNYIVMYDEGAMYAKPAWILSSKRKTQYEEATVDEYGVTAVSAVTGILIQNGTDLR